MKYYAIKSLWNWADEMDIQTLEFVSEEDLNKMKAYANKILEEEPDAEIETYVGTNEEIYITIKDVIGYLNGTGRATNIKEISESTYNELKIIQVNETIYDLFIETYEELE